MSKALIGAAFGFYFIGSIWTAGSMAYEDARELDITIPAGCTWVGHTGEQDEHFPVVHCADGSYLYADMDGDGRHAETRGRWLDASGYVLHGAH